MGVKGLTSFIHGRHPHLLKRTNLKDQNVVIDGFGLAYYLYFEIGGLNSSLGGEYGGFKEIIETFFMTLKRCHITSYVVFDGAITKEKAQCTTCRNQKRIDDLKKIRHGKLGICILPQLCIFIMQDVMRRHDVAFIVATGDADAENVAWSNKLDCPVLANDSDYFIYDVKGGYVPLQSLDWKDSIVDDHISCDVYHSKMFAEYFDMKMAALPFLSAFIGNDWMTSGEASCILSKLNKKNSSRKYCAPIMKVITWLKNDFHEEETFLQFIKSRLTRQEYSRVMASVLVYADLPDVTQRSFIHDRDAKDLQLEELVHFGLAPGYCFDLYNLKEVYLPVVPFDTQQRSPYTASEEIRYAVYTLLCSKYNILSIKIKEFDAHKHTYCSSNLVLSPQCDVCGNQCKLGTSNDVELLMEHVVGKDIKIKDFLNICEKLKNLSHDETDYCLLLLAMIFWSNGTKNAVLVAIFALLVVNTLMKESMLIAELLTTQKEISSDFNPSFEVLQASAELQGSFLALQDLNKICGNAFNEPNTNYSIFGSNVGVQLLYKKIQRMMPKHCNDKVKFIADHFIEDADLRTVHQEIVNLVRLPHLSL